VARARRLLHEKRIGHTGTLDPFATGVLVLMVGRATRLAQFLNTAEKEYVATVRFGYATDTGDLTGTALSPVGSAADACRRLNALTRDQLNVAMASLRGAIQQVPPMYSAKKIEGRKLYELARQGKEVERKSVDVSIHEFEPVYSDRLPPAPEGFPHFTENADGTMELSVRVVCSAGTYVRTLAESLGAALGVGAHLSTLRRTRAGNFTIEGSVTLDVLSETCESGGNFSKLILSPDAALPDMPFLHLSSDAARNVRHGRSITAVKTPGMELQDGGLVRLRGEDGALLAIGFYEAAMDRILPRIVLATED
jgi:tRNA pseudouridine55 synthase